MTIPMEDLWLRVDAYLVERLTPLDQALEQALVANRNAGLPPIDVSPAQGKLLELFVAMTGARRILEVGALGGYSTICLARGLIDGGSVTTLELDPHHAKVAKANIERAGLADRVEIRVGVAVETLSAMVEEKGAPFDLVFIDADKESSADYLAFALRLSRPGTLILLDNVVREGAVIDAGSDDPRVQGVRRAIDFVAAEPRLAATALQTVGAKGWDGLLIALVQP